MVPTNRVSAEKPMRLVKLVIQACSILAVFALCATHAVDAQTRHHAAKSTAPIITKLDAKIPVEMNRDPADIALDRKIKGICRGC
jgi:hypothetical protein